MSSVKALVENLIKENPVLVFSKSYCPYCTKAKGLLTSLNVPFRALELDKESNGKSIQDFLAEKTGQSTVPNIFIKGDHIGGCDDLHMLHSSNKLKPKVSDLIHAYIQMGGDLNMKKSWHPLTKRNQERVWKAEQLAEQERKKMNQLRKELAEERDLEDLRRLQEESGMRKKSNRLEWMYEGGSATAGGSSDLVNDDMEAVLLGRKRIDELLTDKNSSESGERINNLMGGIAAGAKMTSFGLEANSERDTTAKSREDPLFQIKQRQVRKKSSSRARKKHLELFKKHR